MLKTIQISHRCFGILLCGAIKQNWSFWFYGSVVCLDKRTAYNEAWRGLGDALGLSCFRWLWKPTVREGQDGFNLVLGIPRRKCHDSCEEVEACP